MFTSRLSRYAVGGALGVLVATGLFDGPLSLVSAAQYFQPASIVPFTTVVDRTRKGDRLQTPDAGTTIIIRHNSSTPTIDARDNGDPRLVPTSLEECEPVASPYADPKLGKFAGRCFV